MPENRHITVSGAAKLLNESPSTTLRRVQKGSLRAEKLGDSTSPWVIAVTEVEALRDQLAVERQAKVERLRRELAKAEALVEVAS